MLYLHNGFDESVRVLQDGWFDLVVSLPDPWSRWSGRCLLILASPSRRFNSVRACVLSLHDEMWTRHHEIRDPTVICACTEEASKFRETSFVHS